MKHNIVILFCILSIFALCSNPLTKSHVGTLRVAINGGPRICKQIISIKEARFKNVVPQSLDFSCGVAALATLLKFQFGKDVTEADIIKGMFMHGNRNLIKKRGFSLLDMKSYGQSIDYQVSGYRLKKIEQLRRINIPTILLIDVRGYSHFVVLKGIIGNKVFIADPAWGNRTVDLEEFSKAWNNVIAVVRGQKEGIPVGLAAVNKRAIGPKGQILKIKERVLDRFVMDTSTPLTRVSGSYPWR